MGQPASQPAGPEEEEAALSCGVIGVVHDGGGWQESVPNIKWTAPRKIQDPLKVDQPATPPTHPPALLPHSLPVCLAYGWPVGGLRSIGRPAQLTE